jgi:hypothetical protein
MKKAILFICLTAFTLCKAFAQDFNLTSNGFVSANDDTKSFVVIEVSGTQQELYNKAKTYLMRNYRSPKDVLSESEFETITINGISEDVVQKKAMGMVAVSYDMNYTIVLMFKDGRIRIDAPFFSLYSYNGPKQIKLLLKGKANSGLGTEVINIIYDNKDKLKADYAKEQLEAFFNSYIKDLVIGMTESANNDW